MKKIILAAIPALVLIGSASFVFAKNGGFNQYGYNYTARIFNGDSYGLCEARGWSRAQCDNYFGAYAPDKLVMKWNAEWDRGNQERWNTPPYEAWLDNEWNGKFPGGSGEVWHYKIVWVGADLEQSPYWRQGGYPIWGQFEVIMDQGVDPNQGPGHIWYSHASPNGYGSR